MMDCLTEACNNLEKRISSLEKPMPSDEDSPEAQQRAKQLYQINIMKRSLTELAADFGKKMVSIQFMVNELFKVAISRAFPQLAPVSSCVRSSSKGADYQCDSALQLQKDLKAIGCGGSPRETASKIVANLPTNDIVERSEVAGPGFINIWLSKSFVQILLSHLCHLGVRPPTVGDRKRVVVDFSSPNIAKEMHVGHLRSTIIGDAISRLCEFVGHDVVRINHVGDWGTQFGMLIAHLQDRFPDYTSQSPDVSDLQAFYKESKKRFDSDEAFKARAYECVVKLQQGDDNHMKAWRLICDVSRKEFQRIYDRLEVRIIERGESYYQNLMDRVVAELKEKNLLQEDEGRLVMFPTEEAAAAELQKTAEEKTKEGGIIPLTVVKSDGGYTYDTSDLAALWQRINVEKADWIIYVVDNGQGVHFDTLFGCGRRLGWIDPKKNRIEHVGFGLVLGEDRKKFKTRSGETVRLAELLDQGIDRATKKLGDKRKEKEAADDKEAALTEEERRQTIEAVAYGCVKYADLAHTRTLDYVFSFDKMLDDKGNTAVYLLYAYTRIRSIARTAQVSAEQLATAAKAKFTDGLTGPICLDDPREFKLAKFLLRFSELCNVFTEFYSGCYCVEKDSAGAVQRVHIDRLLLCDATLKVLKAGFDILGLRTVSRM